MQIAVPVTVAEAALGAKIDLPTPHGTVTLTVPPGSSGGRLLRLKGLGVKRSGGKAGDLVAELRIVIPSELTPDQRTLFESLATGADDENPRRDLKW